MSEMIRIHGSIKENMDMALQQEDILNRCPPCDPYCRIAKVNIEFYLDAAARLERGETHMPDRSFRRN